MQSLNAGRPGLAGSHFGVDVDNEADIKVKHPAAGCGASGAPQVRTGCAFLPPASWRVPSEVLYELMEAVVLL